MVTEGCSYVSGDGDIAARVGGKSTSTTSRSIGFSSSSKTFNKFNVQAKYDDAWSAGNNKKKKARTGAVGGGGEKAGGRGLRQFSIQVCKKVESKGRTTYNEVMDELVADLSTTTPYMKPNCKEKNIRRRVYDSLNVLISADIISKDKNKEIQWRGILHAAGQNAVEQLKSNYLGLRNKIAKKVAYLQELEDQFVGLHNLAQRNEQLCCSGRKAATSGGVPLPFIIIQTPPSATIDWRCQRICSCCSSISITLVRYMMTALFLSLWDFVKVLRVRRKTTCQRSLTLQFAGASTNLPCISTKILNTILSGIL
ncbi:hypothetical protein MKW98_025953 [Papaver atlanticum]|uniref:Uncharacterized protein n=1 Tax=Papaver atlanticum TaxID=357466 RepID=A0AAD4SIT3_9MAGN|nr:hypothetical protein MKW98_025953 [Papaver atlanticum]